MYTAKELAESAIRLDNDVNGNPRYYLPAYLFESRPPFMVMYRGKKFGAGWVIQSYSLESDLERVISEMESV